MSSNVTVEVSERIATITFNSPKTLNAITQADYDAFTNALREVDARDDVLVTIWQANGKWFSAAWLSAPFAFLGIATEGCCSVTFRSKMGTAKANEVLIWGKKMDAQELLKCGFINQILPQQTVPEFQAAVRKLVLERLEHSDPVSLLTIKRLIKAGLKDQHNFDAVNLRESYVLAERFASGVPVERLQKIARKELKHKL
ncbi:ClpP/crotonase [Cubamyces sp. BRFM 1775]|nr:ClpP/crotonase [Cubamyces sp. BRFM 1775]